MRRSIRLAVCDDEAPVLSYLTDQIRKEFGKYDLCAEADIFISPVELEKVLREKSYDVYFLDIDMPKMNGIETFERMKGFAPEIPVIFLTASGLEEDVVSAIKLGAVNYLKKPYRPQELLKRISQEFEAR